jgi:dTDP-4-dehydrorhamnose 3,5-epimerase
MLEGIIINQLARNIDERGSFTELIRDDDREILGDDTIVQANLSVGYPSVIRAWHRHLRGQNDYFVVLSGAIKICAYSDERKELTEIISSGEQPKVVKIPGHYWHGTKVIGNQPAMLLYFVNRLYNYEKPDEERRPWNDQKIVPITINGVKDNRCSIPWDWNYPVHK